MKSGCVRKVENCKFQDITVPEKGMGAKV
jgi:hypothetical protein